MLPMFAIECTKPSWSVPDSRLHFSALLLLLNTGPEVCIVCARLLLLHSVLMVMCAGVYRLPRLDANRRRWRLRRVRQSHVLVHFRLCFALQISRFDAYTHWRIVRILGC